MSFFSHGSSSSSEDEGFWPPPGRRKRHPAGNRQPDDSNSTSSSDCVSNILFRSSDPMFIAQNGLKPHRFHMNQSPNSSSGIFSQPGNFSYQSSEMNFPSLFSESFDAVQNCSEKANANLCSRFNICRINDDQPNVEDQSNSSTPPMLRRFLDSQDNSRTNCSQSLPPVRFQTWVDGSRLS
ncbi:unnamed protein product [Schistosoma guineensis]|nr:unnamed protein product [Schistosoma intercalatum]CAH8561995.1 unnamed protein product [Schistosoma intercalatum]CAH8572444.1 unnamed protein product [Schistosoma guineensis]